jgi:hypothetical protein
MFSRFLAYGSAAGALFALCMVPMGTFGQDFAPAAQAKIKAAAAKPTPRTADGHPDLSGAWGGVGGFDASDTSAHQGSDGTIFIDIPPENGGAKPRIDRTLDEQLQPPAD